MDTKWFAIDSEGRVGLFDTGEDGALPIAAGNLGGPCDPNFDSLIYDAAMLVRSRKGEWPKRESPPSDEKHRWLVVKPRPGLSADEFDEIATEPYWVGLSKEAVKYSKLPERDSFTALSEDEFGFGGGLGDDDEAGPEAGAFFHFTRDHGEAPGLYERDGVVVACGQRDVQHLGRVAPPASRVRCHLPGDFVGSAAPTQFPVDGLTSLPLFELKLSQPVADPLIEELSEDARSVSLLEVLLPACEVAGHTMKKADGHFAHRPLALTPTGARVSSSKEPRPSWSRTSS